MIDKEDAIVRAATALFAAGKAEKTACDEAEKLIDELQARGYVKLDEIKHVFQIDGKPTDDPTDRFGDTL